jgi:hypothetical protein
VNVFVFILFLPCFLYATEISPIIGFGQENLNFEVKNYESSNSKSFKFDPNISGITRIGVSAFGLSAGYSLRGSEKEIDPSKPKTDMTEIQLGYNSPNWGVDGYYQTYKGFVTTGTNTTQSFPDLEFKHTGFIARYALHESEFSTGGLLDQSYPVDHTSYKIYLVGGLGRDEMNTEVSLMQLENAGLDPEFENLRGLKATVVKLGAGAGAYYVTESKFFLGGLLDLLNSYANYEFASTTGNSTLSDLSTSYDVKLGLGYSGEKFKSGLSLSADMTDLKTPGRAQVNPSSNRILLYFRWLVEI